MKSTVLFVDDEQPILKAITRLFHNAPYTVVTHSNPQVALSSLPDISPDVIVCDYRMPGMDGITFLREAAERHCDSMRILLTGYADVGIAQEAINEAGVYKFLTKPWRDLELHTVIQTAVFDLQNQRSHAAEVQAEREVNVLLKSLTDDLQCKLAQSEGATANQERMRRLQLGATTRGLLTALFAGHPPLRRLSEWNANAGARLIELAGDSWLRDSMVMAGWLHEIGLIGLPKASKTPKPTLQSEILHCDQGAKILQAANYPSLVVEAVLHHHENWDASGPRGFQGTQISLLARCLRTVDYLSGMLRGHVDSDYLPDQALISVLDAALGRQLDPRLGGLLIKDIQTNGARGLFPRRSPQLPEFDKLSVPLLSEASGYEQASPGR